MRRELHSKFRAPFSSEDEHFRSHQAEIRFARRVRHRRVRAPSSASRMKSDNNVSVIDTATNMVVATVPMGDDPRGVAVTPDGKQTCHPADPGDAGRPWLEDAQRVGTPFPPRDLD